MAPLGPFERQPTLAVAVSGGADSLALVLLADRWATLQGGKAIALTIDHGLRAESAAEAFRLGEWLASRRIAHVILPWLGPRPENGVQAAAREARYRLLTEWCSINHVLHLLLAHHQDDQAETLLLRLARGSGVDGLSAMAGCKPQSHLQILRPFLRVPKKALRHYLRQEKQDWIEDPSNQSEQFDRVQWRKVLAGERISTVRLAVTSQQLGRARKALEQATAALAVDAVMLDVAGFAWLDPRVLAQASEEIALRLLSALVRTIGGSEFPPRLQGLERIYAALRQDNMRRRTFGGCVFAPHRDGNILVHREVALLSGPQTLAPGGSLLWDGRFFVRSSVDFSCTVSALPNPQNKQWRAFAEKRHIPRIILPTLPAIMDNRGILAVPHIGYSVAEVDGFRVKCDLAPRFPLIDAGFLLVTANGRTIYEA